MNNEQLIQELKQHVKDTQKYIEELEQSPSVPVAPKQGESDISISKYINDYLVHENYFTSREGTQPIARKSSDVYAEYNKFCADNNYFPVTQRTFSTVLSRTFYKKRKKDANYFIMYLITG